MEQTEYKIKLDPPPDGMEIIGTGVSQKGDFAYMETIDGFRWREVGEKGDWLILARRRQSLADWANGQRLFQALAEMRKDDGIDTSALGCTGDAWWNLFCDGFHACKMNLGLPPRSGAIKLSKGKWVDA